MKYLLLIQYGDTPVPPSDEWDRLSQDAQKAVFAGYQAVNETPGVTPGVWLEHPRAAATSSTRPTTSTRRSSSPRASRLPAWAVQWRCVHSRSSDSRERLLRRVRRCPSPP
jgi:hypothetical protein